MKTTSLLIAIPLGLAALMLGWVAFILMSISFAMASAAYRVGGKENKHRLAWLIDGTPEGGESMRLVR